MALVELRLSPLPSHVRTARLVGVAAARRAGLAAELVDELRLAIGEACSRAVGLNARHAPDTPVMITVSDDPGMLVVTVSDVGPAAGPAPDDLAGELFDEHPLPTDPETAQDGFVHPDVGLAVVAGVVDDCEITPGPTGTTVVMRWPLTSSPPGATAISRT